MNSNNKKLSLILTVIIIFIFGIFLYKNYIKTPVYSTYCGNYSEKNIVIGNQNIKAIIADDICKQDLGLSGNNGLKNNQGMFFVFTKDGSYGFWMKDMKYPLDMIWINSSLQIVGIEKNISPDTYNATDTKKSEILGESYWAQYVFELPAGFSDKNNVKIGDKITFLE